MTSQPPVVLAAEPAATAAVDVDAARTAADPAAPWTFPRRVLLAVTGLSPQVVTESVYALAVAAAPAFVPTEVHVVTTATGAQRLRLALLSREPGWFERLRADWALPPIAFDERHIHVLPGDAGGALDDIRSPRDNEIAADAITEAVRALTADPACALHVSMAGGRKTMGFFAGYALSLFGRPQDRLSHVLVAEPYEQSLQFFYPTPTPRVVEIRPGVMVDASQANVTLADIPFVSLRHGLPRALLDGHAGFAQTVQAARRALGPASLLIDLEGSRIEAGGVPVRLQPTLLALLALFARRAQAGEEALVAPSWNKGGHELGRLFAAELRLIKGPMGDTERSEMRVAAGMEDDHLRELRSRLNRALKTALGPGAPAYLIDAKGHRPRTYRLTLPPSAIRFGRIER